MRGRSIEARIPDTLLRRLQELKETLSHSGAVVLRSERGRRPTYRLRVRTFIPELGHRKMIAIQIGDAITAKAVRQLLGQWRSEHQRRGEAHRQTANAHRQNRRRNNRERLAMKKLVQEIAGGSNYNRSKVGKVWDDVFREGVIPSTLWLLSRQYLRPHELTGKQQKAAQAALQRQEWSPGSGVDLGAIVRQRAAERRQHLFQQVLNLERSGDGQQSEGSSSYGYGKSDRREAFLIA